MLVLVLALSGSKTSSAVFVRPAGVDMRVRIRRGRSYAGSSGRGDCCEGRHAGVCYGYGWTMQGPGCVRVVEGCNSRRRRVGVLEKGG